MTLLEISAGIGGVLFTGGVGWWAHYITSGAAKAHRLTDTVLEIQASIREHEEREEHKFEEVGLEARGLREAVGELIGSVGELHGKMDELSQFIHSGGRKV